jgi:hypothetical protein
MRKAILVLLVLVAAVLICGCTGNQGKVTADAGSGPQLQDQEALTPAVEVGSVSQEDLDRLQNDLNALEFDGPGGLSGE